MGIVRDIVGMINLPDNARNMFVEGAWQNSRNKS